MDVTRKRARACVRPALLSVMRQITACSLQAVLERLPALMWQYIKSLDFKTAN